MEFKLIEPEEVRNCKLNFVKHTVRQIDIKVEMQHTNFILDKE